MLTDVELKIFYFKELKMRFITSLNTQNIYHHWVLQYVSKEMTTK